MRKYFFIEDKEGPYISTDGTKRYVRLTKNEMLAKINSSKSKYIYFYTSGHNGIQIPDEMIANYRKEERHQQYIHSIKRNYPYHCVPISCVSNNDDLSGEEIIADDTISVEDHVAISIMSEKLMKALEQLDEKERQLIQALFFFDPPLTQTEYAKTIGVTQQAVSKMLAHILLKLKSKLS